MEIADKVNGAPHGIETARPRRYHRQKLEPQQLDELRLIEADHRLAVDDRDRRALKTLTEQLFQSFLVRAHVFFGKLNALLR